MKKNKMFRVGGVIFLVLAGIFLSAVIAGNVACAAGLVDDVVSPENLFSQYPLDNYQLDFYVKTGWDWLPWNWGDGIGKQVQYALYAITNGLWSISILISSATGYVVQQAFKLDLVNDLADKVGSSLQTLSGVSQHGIAKEGFLPGFLLLLIVILGTYVVYTGLIKHESSKALHAVVNFFIVLIVTLGFFAYAPDCIKKVNELSTDISTATLDLGTKIVWSKDQPKKNSVDAIRDNLFAIQVYKPWLLLQFGMADEELIGKDRIEALLGTSPVGTDGKTNSRDEATQKEIETYGNYNLSVTKTGNRLGMVIFLFIMNVGISVFVFLLSAIMLLSQVLFLVFVMFLPLAFILSMVPGYEATGRRAIEKTFNMIMMRAGITLIVTVAFSLSALCYELVGDYPFFLIAFLQIVIFAGIFIKMNEILGMVSLQGNDSQQVGRRIFHRPYMGMRRGWRKTRRKIGNTISRRAQEHRPAGAGAGKAGNQAKAGNRAENYVRAGNRTAVAEQKARENIGTRAGKTVGKVADIPAKMNDKMNKSLEKVKDLPVNARYAAHSVGKGFKEELAQGKEKRKERQEERGAIKSYKREELAESAKARQEERARRMAQRSRNVTREQTRSGMAGEDQTKRKNRPLATPGREKTSESKRTGAKGNVPENKKVPVQGMKNLSAKKQGQMAGTAARKNVNSTVAAQNGNKDVKTARSATGKNAARTDNLELKERSGMQDGRRAKDTSKVHAANRTPSVVGVNVPRANAFRTDEPKTNPIWEEKAKGYHLNGKYVPYETGRTNLTVSGQKRPIQRRKEKGTEK